MKNEPQQSESRTLDKYIVRFPDGMRSRITDAAKENGRSMNAEIIARLDRSFSDGGRESTIAEIKSLLDEQYRKAFEESVIAALERFKNEIRASVAVDGNK